jgi:glucose uptake protein
MFEPASTLALLMTLTSAVCWGSWANTGKMTRNYRFELFYWDYAIGIVVISLIWAFTLGSTGGDNSFLSNLGVADTQNMGSAMIGGFIFNIANLLLVAGINMAGLAVAFPLSIGTAMVVGVVSSYIIQPKGDVKMLAIGVFMAVIAIIMDGLAYGNLPTANQAVSKKSVVVCLVSGVLMGSFAPFVTRAMTHGATLTPYSISVFFTVGALLCCPIVNVYFMKKPLVGDPVDFAGYFTAGTANHLWGLFGGFIWGTGGVFNFVAGGKLGVAVSYAIGQSAPMVAALWGVFVWKEFAGAGGKAKGYLAGMFLFYILALFFISRAYA